MIYIYTIMRVRYPKLLKGFWKPAKKSKMIRILLFPLVRHSHRRVLSIPWRGWETQKPRGHHPQSGSKTPEFHPNSLCNRQHLEETNCIETFTFHSIIQSLSSMYGKREITLCQKKQKTSKDFFTTVIQ